MEVAIAPLSSSRPARSRPHHTPVPPPAAAPAAPASSAALALAGACVAACASAPRTRRGRRAAEAEVAGEPSPTTKSGFKSWWKKNAKMDSKALRKMGLMCLLSYGFVSNVNALLLILLATYRSILATGASPLTDKAALKQFGLTWAGLYVISNLIRPVRISIALAISKPIDNIVKWFQDKLSCKRWLAIGISIFMLNICLTISLLWGGMMLVSAVTGVNVSASQFGVLVKAGKAATKH
ncbi:unnamed protein product [Effrenium voratum]|nr:unnamed protein product [Effrenium voratum]